MRVEAALRESEERLRLIADNMLEMICLTDSDLLIKYTNPAFERELGIPPRELLGKSIFDRVHPDDLPEVKEAVAMALRTKSSGSATFRYRHADGYYLWFETTGSLYFSEDGEIAGAVITNRDITIMAG